MHQDAGAPLSAVVVGAGVGGLTAALALARAGLSVTVVEQAQALGEVGAGLQVSPNATRVLFSLGLEAELSALAFRPEAVEARGWRRGQEISQAPLGESAQARYGFPYFHMHRADLISVLEQACRAEAGIALRLGETVAACPGDGTPALVLASGERLEADILVGADGIRSLVREALFGPAAPRFTGQVAWRGLVPAERLKDAGIRPVASLWMGPGAHFVHYFVRGGTLVNFVGVVEADDWREESWSSRGEAADLRRDFAGWHPTVRRIVVSKSNRGDQCNSRCALSQLSCRSVASCIADVSGSTRTRPDPHVSRASDATSCTVCTLFSSGPKFHESPPRSAPERRLPASMT